MRTKELIKAIQDKTNFIVLQIDGEPLGFCYPLSDNPITPRSKVLATLPQEALSMQEFKEKDIDWKHYKYLKPKQREVAKLYELLNEYVETPMIDRVDDSYFWQEYIRGLTKVLDNALVNRKEDHHEDL